jgi:hypothetical protein
MGEFDNAKTYRIFGSICIAFYSINTYHYTIFYVYCRYLSIKIFTARKMENRKKERKRQENEVSKGIMGHQSKWACGAHYLKDVAPATLGQKEGGARHQPLKSGGRLLQEWRSPLIMELGLWQPPQPSLPTFPPLF